MSSDRVRLTPYTEAELEQLGTSSDVATMAKVSRRTVQEWTYTRKIPSLKIGHTRRYNLTAVRKALARFTVEEVR